MLQLSKQGLMRYCTADVALTFTYNLENYFSVFYKKIAYDLKYWPDFDTILYGRPKCIIIGSYKMTQSGRV